MLKAEAIQKSYPTRAGELVVLRDVSLSLDAGQSAAILGPSGSGKSTLLNILGTLEPPTAGAASCSTIAIRSPCPSGNWPVFATAGWVLCFRIITCCRSAQCWKMS